MACQLSPYYGERERVVNKGLVETGEAPSLPETMLRFIDDMVNNISPNDNIKGVASKRQRTVIGIGA
jgi:hypothetical protein